MDEIRGYAGARFELLQDLELADEFREFGRRHLEPSDWISISTPRDSYRLTIHRFVDLEDSGREMVAARTICVFVHALKPELLIGRLAKELQLGRPAEISQDELRLPAQSRPGMRRSKDHPYLPLEDKRPMRVSGGTFARGVHALAPRRRGYCLQQESIAGSHYLQSYPADFLDHAIQGYFEGVAMERESGVSMFEDTAPTPLPRTNIPGMQADIAVLGAISAVIVGTPKVGR